MNHHYRLRASTSASLLVNLEAIDEFTFRMAVGERKANHEVNLSKQLTERGIACAVEVLMEHSVLCAVAVWRLCDQTGKAEGWES